MTAGRFIWYDLMSDDVDRTAAFYAAVTGWSVSPPSADHGGYRMLTAADGDGVGGLMPAPPGAEGPKRWLAYISVADVDAAVDDIEAAGGSVVWPGMTAAGIGRMALVADANGHAFYVMTPEGAGQSRAFLPGDAASPGHFVWNELSTAGPATAIDWYEARFGWRQEGAMSMGDMGDYSFLHAGPDAIGAVMGPIPGGAPGWMPYVMVDDIDAAAARVAAGGGAVLQPPIEIPGGSFSLVAQDPHGVRFGLVGARRG